MSTVCVLYLFLGFRSNQVETKYAALNEYNQFLQYHNTTNVTSVSNTRALPTVPDVDSQFNICVLAAIIAAVFVFGLARALLFFKIAIDAARNLHNRMFSRVLRANISFFDSNPVGECRNRKVTVLVHRETVQDTTCGEKSHVELTLF